MNVLFYTNELGTPQTKRHPTMTGRMKKKASIHFLGITLPSKIELPTSKSVEVNGLGRV